MSRIVLSWNQLSDFDTFDIFRSTSTIDVSNLPTPVATGLTDTRYSDSSVTSGTTYFYRIRTNYNGLSVLSDEFSLIAEVATNPSPFLQDKVEIYIAANTQTTSNGWQKVLLDTASYDTNSLFDTTNKWIKPKKAGYYLCTARVRFSSSASTVAMSIRKNGSNYVALGTDNAASSIYALNGTTMVYCDGDDDYIELGVYSVAIISYTTGVFDTQLQVIGPF